jgi:hypothetical protein
MIVNKSNFSLLIGWALACATAWGDPVEIVFDSPTLTGSPGDVLAYFGTLTNLSDVPVFLNSDNLNVGGLSSNSINDLFFANVPPNLDASGSLSDTSGDIELFDITIPNVPVGTYTGNYALFGGADSSSSDPLGAADFAVQVQQTSAVPEPAGAGLLIVTFLLLAAATRHVTGRANASLNGPKG